MAVAFYQWAGKEHLMRSPVFMSAVMILTVSQPSWAQQCRSTMDDAEYNKIFAERGRAARLCVTSKASSFERSGESAADIAAAALSECREQMKAVRDVAEQCRGLEAAITLMNVIVPQVRDEAVAQIVKIRAGRKP